MLAPSSEPRAGWGPLRRGRAFGLRLEIGTACPGLPPDSEARRTSPPVRIELAPRHQILACLPADAERIWEARRPDGQLAGRFDVHPDAGYLLEAEGYGAFLVDADACRVKCAPVRDAAWRWQRYLVGQVLPFLAVLHGLEVLHASAIVQGPIAVAFIGDSGAGKSSLAVASVLRGAQFLTDDVLAVGVDDSEDRPPLAHPGFGLTSVRRDVVEALGPEALRRLGRRVGADDDAVRVAVAVAGDALPITALYFLERSERRGRHLIEAIEPLEPRRLLASTYNLVLKDPDRLTRHLDVCARLANTAEAFRIAISPEHGPAEVAAAVDAHTRSLVARR